SRVFANRLHDGLKSSGWQLLAAKIQEQPKFRLAGIRHIRYIFANLIAQTGEPFVHVRGNVDVLDLDDDTPPLLRGKIRNGHSDLCGPLRFPLETAHRFSPPCETRTQKVLHILFGLLTLCAGATRLSYLFERLFDFRTERIAAKGSLTCAAPSSA